MSGAAARYDSRLAGDLDVGLFGPQSEGLFKAEVKARKTGTGFKQLEGWLGNNDLLFLRRNNADAMVTMPWDVFLQIMRVYYDTISCGNERNVESANSREESNE